MRKVSSLGLLLLLPAAVASGARYVVGIGDDCPAAGVCFFPTPLTIQVGDSVKFYNYNSSLFNGPHNVVANDGSFRCARGCDGEGGDGSPRGQSGEGYVDLSLQWSFTRTFTTPGIVAYHDEVSHASGVIVVQEPGMVASVQTAVEYLYGRPWDYGDVSSYFVTSDPDEIAMLDGGAFDNAWHRTGETFNVWNGPANGALPTCRFFHRAFGAHFYTPSATPMASAWNKPGECAALQAEHGWNQGWQYEGMAFYMQLPDSNGNCRNGTTILYRLYNDGIYPPPLYPETLSGAPLHRLTTSAETFKQMRAAGWLFEGDSRTFAFACVPI